MITIDSRAKREQSQRLTVLLNKPVGWVSGQAEDGYEPASVLITQERQWRGQDGRADDRSVEHVGFSLDRCPHIPCGS